MVTPKSLARPSLERAGACVYYAHKIHCRTHAPGSSVVIIDATKAAQNWNLATPFSTMQFGFTHYQTLSNAIDVYLDDFAVNNAMVACPP